MGAIEKAKTILVEGVTAFAQLSSKTRRWNPDDDDESDAVAEKRSKVVTILKQLSQTHHSFAFAQLASMARSDPFVKIRGLIEDMIAKLSTAQFIKKSAIHLLLPIILNFGIAITSISGTYEKSQHLF